MSHFSASTQLQVHKADGSVTQKHPELESTFHVRDAAPDVMLIGNVGVVQAGALGVARVAELAGFPRERLLLYTETYGRGRPRPK